MGCLSNLSKIKLLVGDAVETAGNLIPSHCTILPLLTRLYFLTQLSLRLEACILDNWLGFQGNVFGHGITTLLVHER